MSTSESTKKISLDAVFNASMNTMPLSDQSSSPHPVINKGNATVVTDPVFGAVANFDGSAGTELQLPKADSTGLNLKNQSFTVCAWVKINADAVFDGWRYASILGTDTREQNQGLHLTLQQNGDGDERRFRPFFGFWADDLIGQPTIQHDRWYHVAYSFDQPSKRRSIYVDGSLDTQRNAGNDFIGDTEIYVGRSLSGFYFNGQMFNVRIYNRELTQGEIQQDRSEAFKSYTLNPYIEESLSYLANFSDSQILPDKDFGKALVISNTEDPIIVKQSAYNLAAQEGIVDDFSLEIWLRPQNFSNLSQWSTVLSCGDSQGAFWAIAIGARTGIFWANGNEPTCETLLVKGNLLTADFQRDWNFLTLEYQNGILKLFINGQLRQSRSGLTGFPWPATDIQIGGHTEVAHRIGPTSITTINEKAGNAAVFSPDGNTIVTACTENAARVWDANTGLQLAQLPGTVSSASNTSYFAGFSPDGTHFITGCAENTPRIWDANSYVQIGELKGHIAIVERLAISPDGNKIFTSSVGRENFVWDASTFAQIGELSNFNQAILCAAFSPDGKILVTGGYGANAYIWDTQTYQLIDTFNTNHQLNTLFDVCFSPSGNKIVICGFGVWVWDVENFDLLSKLSIENDSAVRSVAFSPDGQLIITGSTDNTLRWWNAQNYTQIGAPSYHSDSVSDVTFNKDGTKLVTTVFGDGSLIWDMPALTEISLSGRITQLTLDIAQPNNDLVRRREKLITDILSSQDATLFNPDTEVNELTSQLVDISLEKFPRANTVINQAPFQPNGTLKGSPVILVDDVFGRAMDFSNPGDHIQIQPLLINSEGVEPRLTVEFWVHPATTMTSDGTVLFAGVSNGPYWLIRVGTSASVEWSDAAGGQIKTLPSNTPVLADAWSHITLVYADNPTSTGKQLSFFINGTLSGQTELTEFPWTQNEISLGDCELDINRRTASPFMGRLSNVRIHNDKAELSPQAIRNRLEKDLLRTATGTIFPLEFNLLNEQDQAVLYLGDRPKTLRLEIKNTGRKNIRLSKSDLSDNHLSLHFRPGTLKFPNKVLLPNNAWSIAYHQDPDGTDVFDLRYLPGASSTQSETLIPGETLSLELSNILLEPASGSRATQVQMRYSLQYDDSSPLEGSRLHYLSILQMSESEIHHRLRDINEKQLPEMHNNLTKVQTDLTDVDSRVGDVKNQLAQAKNNITAIQTNLSDKVDQTAHTALAERVNNLAVDEARLTDLINQLNDVDSNEADLIQSIAADVKVVADDVDKVGQDIADINQEIELLSNQSVRPLFICIDGPGTILNDGQSTNSITVSISNESDQEITLSNDSKISIKVYGGIKSQNLAAPQWSITNDLASINHGHLAPNWQVTSDINSAGYIKYVLTPGVGSSHKLVKGQPLTINFSGFSCSLPTGKALFEILFENISKPGETQTTVSGQYLLPIERGPIMAPAINNGSSQSPNTVISGATELVLNPTLSFRKENFVAGDKNPPEATLSLDGDTLSIVGQSGVKFGAQKTEIPQLHLTGTVEADSHDIQQLNHLDTNTVMADNGVTYNTSPGNLVPTGAIIMWSGPGDQLPSGWVLCNGELFSSDPAHPITVNGSDRAPDLRDKFIMAAGNTHPVNQQGGTGSFTISSGNLPQHNHHVNDPGHTHSLNRDVPIRDSSTDSDDDSLPIFARNSGFHLGTGRGYTGITINDGGGTANPAAISKIPPFYALCFIMKT